ncbi:IPT/TIG domain-containing protein [Paenibacillus chitinolyticus]|uniref:IPT/TIG domain-containing protein n=1 Tax=Paenibacillus chitinolyticus TaxID=79263 RepID=UPI0036725D58
MRKNMTRVLALILTVLMVTLQLPAFVSASQSSEIVQVTKSINPSEILEGGQTEVSLDVKGSRPVNVVKPNDVVLIIDRSGSMAPTGGEDKIGNAKASAKGFIDLIDFTKHRVAIVDFSSDVKFKDFSTNPTDLKTYVNGIQASGGTATASAIDKARQLLSNHRPDAQPVIVLMTDGEATEPAPVENAKAKALEAANNAKGESVVFYTIALLLSNQNPNTSAPNILMKEMATTAHHHHFVLGSVGLAEIYAAIVTEIGLASAYDVVVEDTVAPEFEIVPGSYKDNIPQPIVSGNKLTWKFNELKDETLTFKYKIQHKTGSKVGSLSVGDGDIKVKYKDYLGAPYAFTQANPTVKVSYPAPVISSIVEKKGLIQGGESVVINGQGFRPNPIILFGDKQATSVEYVSSTKVIAKAPAGAQGIVQLKLTNDDGQYATTEYQYYANPVITKITPVEGPLAGNNQVTIEGSYFMPGAQIKFGDNTATVNTVTSNKATVTAPASTMLGSVNVELVNPDGTKVTVINGYTYINGPEITSVTPNTGLTLGGDSITIAGNHFKEGAKVFFNATQINANVVSESSITLIAPTWPKAESVLIKVINPDGQQAEFAQGYTYTYPSPKINTVEPNQGPVAGGTLISIKGSNFLPGAKVYFDNTLVSPSTVYGNNEIKLNSPRWTAGEAVDVKVINPDGQEVSITDGFTYNLPEAAQITEVLPTSGPIAGGTTVTIKGSNFANGTKIYFDSKLLTISSLSSTQITFKTPAWSSAEKVDFTLVDSFGREVKLTDAYEYQAPPPPPAPELISISPNEGELAGGLMVALTGTNFEAGIKVYFNDTLITATRYNSTDIKAYTPKWSVAGPVNIKVVNADGQEHTLVNGFNYLAPPPPPAPELVSVSPGEGELAGGQIVTLTGKNFESGVKVYFNDTLLSSSRYGTTEIKASTPKWSVIGPVTVKVVNPDGQEVSLANGFNYLAPPAPKLTSLSPANGLITGGTVVTVSGDNFINGATVKLNGTDVPATFVSAKQLKVTTPVWPAAGNVDVTVTNPDGQSVTLPQAFTFETPPPPPAPEITTVSPNSGELAGGLVVTVNGKNFDTGVKVYFNDTQVTASRYSTTQIKVSTPKWTAAGTVNIKVVNTDGQEATLPNSFTYLAPPVTDNAIELVNVTPNEGQLAGGLIVTLNGKNFLSGVKVYFNDTLVSASRYSATQIKVSTPKWVTSGPVNVKVVNPDGQESTLTGGFVYLAPPAPTISTISPGNGLMTGGTTVVITGENFVNGAKVNLNETQVSTTFVSSKQLKFVTPAWMSSESVNVTVTNPDGQTVTLPQAFKFETPPPQPGPEITSVSPNTGALSGNLIITITGKNFGSGVKVYFNDTLLTASRYSTTQIKAYTAKWSTLGPVNIKVVNPDGQETILTDGFTYK